MPHAHKSILTGLFAAGALALAAPSAQAVTDSRAHHDCFFVNQWQGWKSPSPKVIYIRVNNRDIYRLDLSADATELSWPDVHLVNRVHGADTICSALDLDLEVSDDHGFRVPVIVQTLTKLTPAEAAAIPRKFQP